MVMLPLEVSPGLLMGLYFGSLMIPEGVCQADERPGGKMLQPFCSCTCQTLGAWKALEAGHPGDLPAQMRLIWPEGGPVPSS